MHYQEGKVLDAFDLYTKLARDGKAGIDAVNLYKADDEVRSLADLFVAHVDCVLILAGDEILMIPETRLSPFHVNNDYIKRTYLRSGATNGDIYLLYFAMIVLFGSFYDSYQTQEPTRNFLKLDEWVRAVQERIEVLREHDEETIRSYEKEFSYNWSLIIEKWEAMNDIKESAKKQSGNTISRLSFIHTVRNFMIDQELIEDIGNDEVMLTEKAKAIVQRYFMEVEYNKGILEFLYQWEETSHAID
ncbi:DUF6063 family protein [Jeotgalibacillus malaysiensis]|uniref:DUF6063 family protein n=1 Tax=Jeotgalibacillus malaysiensis TaxID=1508404 RepID=UPI00384D9238